MKGTLISNHLAGKRKYDAIQDPGAASYNQEPLASNLASLFRDDGIRLLSANEKLQQREYDEVIGILYRSRALGFLIWLLWLLSCAIVVVLVVLDGLGFIRLSALAMLCYMGFPSYFVMVGLSICFSHRIR